MTSLDFSLRRDQGANIAQWALTNSKRPSVFVDGVYPTHAERGHGCKIWCQGKPYIDYVCGLGSNLFGYANQTINNAALKSLSTGAVLSLSSDTEIVFTRKLKEVVRFIEKVKILKTGTEACMAAIKIARAHTKRSMILSDGYHGWADEFVSLTPPASGCVGGGFISKLNMDLSNINSNVACVIVEPVITDYSSERGEWLKALRQKCDEHGVVLIFDEIITGLRFKNFTVSEYFGVYPDLICLGKAIGGGLPLSVVGGSAELMDQEDYFVSSTFAGDRVALSAGIAALELVQTTKKPETLWDYGLKFQQGFNELFLNLKIEGYPSRGVFKGHDMTKALLWQEAVRAGILFGPSWFYSHAHVEYNDMVLSTLKDISIRIKTGVVGLRGQMPQTPFAQKQRG